MSIIFEKIGSVVAAVALAIGGLFGYVPEQPIVYAPEPIVETSEVLGADSVLPIAGMTYTLAGTGISSSATSFVLTSFTITQNGKKIQDSEMSDLFYFTLEPGSRTRQEIVECTTVTQNADGTATISGCTRGMSPVTPYTASTSLQFSHAGGSIAIISNPPQLINQMAIKDNDETITGQWTFDIFPITASTSLASATTSGDVELATGAEAASSTLAGSSGSRLALGTDIATSSAPSSGNVVVVTGDDGNIDAGFIPTISDIQVFTTSGTWTKSTSTAMVEVIAIGGGGGGGGGGRAADASSSSGGGGGAGGGYTRALFTASTLDTTIAVTVGTGGAGGAGGASNGNDGATGTPGQASRFGSILTAMGGNGGGRGGAVISAGGQGASSSIISNSVYGLAQTDNAAGSGQDGANTMGNGADGIACYAIIPCGGGAGEAQNASANAAGKTGGSILAPIVLAGGAGGTDGGTSGGNGSAGTSASSTNPIGGAGGGGGASAINASAAGNGGNGGLYGGGGGGGGASENGTSGNGGAGGDGIVVVISYR